jgi:hypothetical protein
MIAAIMTNGVSSAFVRNRKESHQKAKCLEVFILGQAKDL